MKRTTQHQRERAYIERELGDEIVCQRCEAKLANYALLCQSIMHNDQCEMCGAIEAARAKFRAGEYGEER